MNIELLKNITQIKKLCTTYKVKSLFAFGSVTTDKFNDSSDVDLIVDIDSTDPFEYSDHYFNFKEQLQKLFDRPVDLLENKAVKNQFLRKKIDSTKVLIYG